MPDPFLENQNSAYLWINSLKLYTTCFYYMPIWGLFQHIETETTPQTQNASWTYIRRSEDVLDVFWTSCVRSVYVLPLRGELQATWFYLVQSSFEKQKEGWNLASLPHFLHDYLRKLFLLLCSIIWKIFIVRLLLLHEILGKMCIVIVC